VGSDRAAERWREDYLIPGTETLELHHLYRAMAFLGQEVEPKGQKTLGSPRCLKDLIEEELFERRRDLFTEVDLVFFDTTSLYFEGRGGESIGKRGHNKDHRPDLYQMVVGMALDVEGRPICCEMWPGNTADVKTLIPIVKRMKERFRLREITVVADRGMVSQATLEAFEKSEPPVRYIVGVRMRRQKEVNTSVLGSRARWFESVPERSNAKDPAPLKVKEVWVKERRYIVCLNEEERRKDAHDREAIVAHLKEQLRNGDKSLVGNKGYRRYLKVEGSGHFVIDEKQVKAEERYDGIWVLRTNTVYDTETVAHVYKALWAVEDIFRTSKSILDTRPIYHKRDETIRGHVFCSFLALVLKQELESRIKQADLQWEWKEVIRGLDALQQVEANFQGRRFLLRSQLTADASQAVRATGVAIPLLCANSSDSAVRKCSAKRLLALRKSLNVNDLIFQTVEDGLDLISSTSGFDLIIRMILKQDRAHPSCFRFPGERCQRSFPSMAADPDRLPRCGANRRVAGKCRNRAQS